MVLVIGELVELEILKYPQALAITLLVTSKSGYETVWVEFAVSP